MAKPTRKTLPKDFGDILDRGDMAEMTAVFETCQLDARGGTFKSTALGFSKIPEPLMHWLLEKGADLSAGDSYGDTPLHSHCGSIFGKPALLLRAGADIEAVSKRGQTPLHSAAGAYRADTVALLLTHRADPDVKDAEGFTPLAHAMRQCQNTDLDAMARVAELLVQSGAEVSDKIPGFVTRVGEKFEFHRAAFNKASVDKMSRGLQTLYALFNVPPVPRRVMHNGEAEIVMPEGSWQKQHSALWDMLVPSSGAAKTVQGEVIRIAGRIAHELDGNGGVNWREDHKKMVAAFLEHVSGGVPVSDLPALRAELGRIKSSDTATRLMMERAVDWVGSNPSPVELPPPSYKI